MFKRRKLYKIVYRRLSKYTMFIKARDESHALKKFYKKTDRDDGLTPSLVMIEEVKSRRLGRG